MKAYDLQFEQPSPGTTPAGWTGGNPPGLRPNQWPRSTTTGHPMNHVFTLELPDDYRRQGPERGAISFFQADYGEAFVTDPRVPALFNTGHVAESDHHDPFIVSLKAHLDNRHPLQWDLTDLLGVSHAVIWLTIDEFSGPSAETPPDVRTPAQRAVDGDICTPWLTQPWVADRLKRRPLFLVERVGDPNVGKVPGADDWIDLQLTDDPAYRDLRYDLQVDHLGGSVFPVQTLPENLTAYVLEFGEIGPVNLGAGRAQLDLESRVFDWAC